MKKNLKGKITNIQKISSDVVKMEFTTQAKEIEAGQFVSVLCPNKTLRRPFSVAGFENGKITVLFKLKGEGTHYLKSLKIGDEIDYLAPLGHGFKIENKKSLLIGAGIGIAPMLYLKYKLKEQGIETFLISGFKNNDEIIKGSDRVKIGDSVLDELPKMIEEFEPEILYSCGPEIVLKNVSKIAKEYNIHSQIAMEKVMACGIGVCRGCAVKIIKDGIIKNATVCNDGPVFYGEEVVWQI